MTAHEALEPGSVEVGLDGGEELSVRAEEVHLYKLLGMLLAVPRLQEVYDAQMVRLVAVWGDEPVPLKSGKLGAGAHGAPTVRVDERMRQVLCVHLHLALDS